jgi:hypothetical protein
MFWRGLISLAATAAAVWALMIVTGALPSCLNNLTLPAHANDAGNPQRRTDYAAKLQDVLNATGRTHVSAEGPNKTVLRVADPIAFRRQFTSLLRPYWNDLRQQGFESVLLCPNPAQRCAEYFFTPGFVGP